MLDNLRISARRGVGFGFLFASVIMVAFLGYWVVTAESSPEMEWQPRAMHGRTNPTIAIVVVNR